MSNKIKLQSSINPVNLTLTTEPLLVSGGGGAHFVYNANFIAAPSTNPINHNLNKYCSVTVVDENNDVVIGEIHYDSLNQVTLTFTAAFSGKAFFN